MTIESIEQDDMDTSDRLTKTERRAIYAYLVIVAILALTLLPQLLGWNWAFDWWGVPTWIYYGIALCVGVIIGYYLRRLVNRFRGWRDLQETKMQMDKRRERRARMSADERGREDAARIRRMCDQPHVRAVIDALPPLTESERAEAAMRISAHQVVTGEQGSMLGNQVQAGVAADRDGDPLR